MITIGEAMRQARKSSGMTQVELSEISGVHRSSISEYECGIRFPNVLVLWSIADALNIEIDVLVGRRERGNKKSLWY